MPELCDRLVGVYECKPSLTPSGFDRLGSGYRLLAQTASWAEPPCVVRRVALSSSVLSRAKRAREREPSQGKSPTLLA